MAKVSFQASIADTGKTARFYVVRQGDTKFANATLSAFETYNAANYTTTKYMVAMSEIGSLAYFSGTFPAWVAAGTIVDIVAKFDTVVGTPAVGDRVAAQGTYYFDGVDIYPMVHGNIVRINGALTDGTPAAGNRPALSLTSLSIAQGFQVQGGVTFAGAGAPFILLDSDDLSAVSVKAAFENVYVIDGNIDELLEMTAGTGASRAFSEAALANAPVPGDIVGPGASPCTLTITDDGTALGTPVADADVWLTSDAAGTNTVAGTLQTDSAGEVTFLLDPGVTYYVWAQKDGAMSISGTAYVAVAD